MAGWVLPMAAYIVVLGASGVTTKLALRTLEWRQLVLWVPLFYLVISVGFVVLNGTRFPLGVGGAWAAVTALCASAALILFFYALTQGDASVIVPVGAAAPVVTLVGSALFLSESITPPRVVGTLLVVAGVALISR
jgi:uncharacterized membrane protein